MSFKKIKKTIGILSLSIPTSLSILNNANFDTLNSSSYGIVNTTYSNGNWSFKEGTDISSSSGFLVPATEIVGCENLEISFTKGTIDGIDGDVWTLNRLSGIDANNNVLLNLSFTNLGDLGITKIAFDGELFADYRWDGVTYTNSPYLGCVYAFTFPTETVRIGEGIFKNQCKFKDLYFIENSNYITSLPNQFCLNCFELQNVYKSATLLNLREIGDQDFKNCLHLNTDATKTSERAFYFPQNITRIGVESFHTTPWFWDILVPPSLTYLGDRCFGAVDYIEIPNNVTNDSRPAVGSNWKILCFQNTDISGSNDIILGNNIFEGNEGDSETGIAGAQIYFSDGLNKVDGNFEPSTDNFDVEAYYKDKATSDNSNGWDQTVSIIFPDGNWIQFASTTPTTYLADELSTNAVFGYNAVSADEFNSANMTIEIYEMQDDSIVGSDISSEFVITKSDSLSETNACAITISPKKYYSMLIASNKFRVECHYSGVASVARITWTIQNDGGKSTFKNGDSIESVNGSITPDSNPIKVQGVSSNLFDPSKVKIQVSRKNDPDNVIFEQIGNTVPTGTEADNFQLEFLEADYSHRSEHYVLIPFNFRRLNFENETNDIDYYIRSYYLPDTSTDERDWTSINASDRITWSWKLKTVQPLSDITVSSHNLDSSSSVQVANLKNISSLNTSSETNLKNIEVRDGSASGSIISASNYSIVASRENDNQLNVVCTWIGSLSASKQLYVSADVDVSDQDSDAINKEINFIWNLEYESPSFSTINKIKTDTINATYNQELSRDDKIVLAKFSIDNTGSYITSDLDLDVAVTNFNKPSGNNSETDIKLEIEKDGDLSGTIQNYNVVMYHNALDSIGNYSFGFKINNKGNKVSGLSLEDSAFTIANNYSQYEKTQYEILGSFADITASANQDGDGIADAPLSVSLKSGNPTANPNVGNVRWEVLNISGDSNYGQGSIWVDSSDQKIHWKKYNTIEDAKTISFTLRANLSDHGSDFIDAPGSITFTSKYAKNIDIVASKTTIDTAIGGVEGSVSQVVEISNIEDDTNSTNWNAINSGSYELKWKNDNTNNINDFFSLELPKPDQYMKASLKWTNQVVAGVSYELSICYHFKSSANDNTMSLTSNIVDIIVNVGYNIPEADDMQILGDGTINGLFNKKGESSIYNFAITDKNKDNPNVNVDYELKVDGQLSDDASPIKLVEKTRSSVKIAWDNTLNVKTYGLKLCACYKNGVSSSEWVKSKEIPINLNIQYSEITEISILGSKTLSIDSANKQSQYSISAKSDEIDSIDKTFLENINYTWTIEAASSKDTITSEAIKSQLIKIDNGTLTWSDNLSGNNVYIVRVLATSKDGKLSNYIDITLKNTKNKVEPVVMYSAIGVGGAVGGTIVIVTIVIIFKKLFFKNKLIEPF